MENVEITWNNDETCIMGRYLLDLPAEIEPVRAAAREITIIRQKAITPFQKGCEVADTVSWAARNLHEKFPNDGAILADANWNEHLLVLSLNRVDWEQLVIELLRTQF